MNYIYIIVAAIIGLALGWVFRKLMSKYLGKSTEEKAKKLLTEAKVKRQEIFFEAREKALKVIEEAKEEEKKRRNELKELEQKLEKRQERFEKKILELEERRKKVSQKEEDLEEAREKIKSLYEKARNKLQEIAEMDKEEAKQALMDNIEDKIEEDIVKRIKKLEKEGSERIEKKAKEMMTNVVERCASSHVAEITTSTVSLPSDEMKGRIIGREGRNINVLEKLTGAEVIVDDTPEAVTVSAFNPIRRRLAKLSLEKLVLDGRIQPARIERVIKKTKKELAKDIRETGEEAVYKVGVAGLDSKLTKLLGRLKFRSSYGQNVLKHSIEVANLSAMLASELDGNVAVAKKAGILHDIGKAMDHEVQGTHPEIGRDICKKHGISEEVIEAAMSHHEDHPGTLEGVIVKVADALSGGRPGARRDDREAYVKRLEELEEVANHYEGTKKAYAIQAGRELRVFVKPDEINDAKAHKLAREISDQIEQELKYPGEIKVTVIRENRVIEYAK